jgi:carbamoyl-phosphate synthase small subunit
MDYSRYIISGMKKTSDKNCLLLLDNGIFFLGKGYGYHSDYFGEICFNTSITGYQEILTDPSYFKQIINFTFPHIGIVGTNQNDYESSKIFASACIVNNNITQPSNYRSEKSFQEWLLINKTACITDVDTRMLTKSIRDSGVCRALIHFPKGKIEKLSILEKKLKNFPMMKSLDLASEVTTEKIYCWKNQKKKTIQFSQIINKNFIAVIDFGIKKKILNLLENIGYSIIVFPCTFSFEKIIQIKPKGIFLSNGPGDPQATFKKIESQISLLKTLKIPTFGICLGHQILAILFGGKTEKMHHGHRGANHPIKNLKSGNVEITVQNHGFVVSKKKLPVNINITHKSLFDGTIAGIKIKNKPFFSVKYHPEA